MKKLLESILNLINPLYHQLNTGNFVLSSEECHKVSNNFLKKIDNLSIASLKRLCLFEARPSSSLLNLADQELLMLSMLPHSLLSLKKSSIFFFIQKICSVFKETRRKLNCMICLSFNLNFIFLFISITIPLENSKLFN